MADDFDGYRTGDITYCVVPSTTDCFPVRVEKVGKNFLETSPLDQDSARAVSSEFTAAQSNRRFYRPKLPPRARFGGCDERLVNSKRQSGIELRLLPTYYGTTATALILEKHAADPQRWPLPTGLVGQRYFRDKSAS